MAGDPSHLYKTYSRIGGEGRGGEGKGREGKGGKEERMLRLYPGIMIYGKNTSSRYGGIKQGNKNIVHIIP